MIGSYARKALRVGSVLADLDPDREKLRYLILDCAGYSFASRMRFHKERSPVYGKRWTYLRLLVRTPSQRHGS